MSRKNAAASLVPDSATGGRTRPSRLIANFPVATIPRTLSHVALATALHVGCAGEDSSAEHSQSSKEVQTEQELNLEGLEARIDAVHALLAEQEAKALRAKREAELFECQARNERLKAEAAKLEARCLQEQALHARCAAEVARAKGDSSLLGCFVGLGVALATGGATAPWALGGCGAGRVAGEIVAKECPPPSCVRELAETSSLSKVLRGENLAQLPLCGGRLGITLEPHYTAIDFGWRVVEPGIFSGAGLAPGYVIDAINGQPFSESAEPLKFLEDLRGSEVQMSFIHQQQRFVARASLPQTGPSGLKVEPSPSVTYASSVTIVAVDLGSDLARENAAGRTLRSVDGIHISSVFDVHDAIRYRLPGETVRLLLEDAGRPSAHVTVTLSEPLEAR